MASQPPTAFLQVAPKRWGPELAFSSSEKYQQETCSIPHTPLLVIPRSSSLLAVATRPAPGETNTRCDKKSWLSTSDWHIFYSTTHSAPHSGFCSSSPFWRYLCNDGFDWTFHDRTDGSQSSWRGINRCHDIWSSSKEPIA